MTKPTPRKKTAPRKKPTAPAKAQHALAAEATGGTLGFVFRDHQFTVDYRTADFGKAMFAYKVAGRTGNVATQFERLIDCLEAILGEDQVVTLYEAAPDLFSSEEAQREFWEQFAKLTVGADLGERSAS